MKQIIVFLWIVLAVGVSFAQTAEDTAAADASDSSAITGVRVLVESALVRAAPTEESEFVASVFENDVLQPIGRNADGTWLEVRRPGRDISLGWVARRLLVVNVDIAALPLTDQETGVTGTEPIIDTGFAIFILTDANLHTAAINSSDRIATIPSQVVIPALERTQDTRWLKVNYLGVVGWVSAFYFNSMIDLSDLPIAPETLQSIANVEIIPPEVQLAQAYRLRDYVLPIMDTTNNVIVFWEQLLDGEVLRCAPPDGNIARIEVSQRDLYELPELRQAARLLPRALDDLNASIDAMERCGIYTPEEINRAYSRAINTRFILSGTLRQIEAVEALLLPQLGIAVPSNE